MKKNKLDKFEEDIVSSVEKEEWISIENIEEEKIRYQSIAKNTLNTNQELKIEISEEELFKLKVKSKEKGIPYEIIIRTLIHNFNTGKLKIII